MEYELKEAMEKLQEFIVGNHKHYKERKNAIASDADIQWDAARFWAKALHATIDNSNYSSLAKFQLFKTNYEATTGLIVNTDQLFNEFWLRNILGYVRIPSTIHSATRNFEELRMFREELQFLRLLQAKNRFREKVTLPIAELETAIEKYQTENALILKREGVLFNRWAATKDGVVGITPIDIYFAPYLDHWDKFEFLFQWQVSLPKSEQGLQITNEALKGLLHSFSHFQFCPTLEDLQDQKVINEIEGLLYINFYGDNPKYWWSLGDRIAGFLWEALIRDDGISSDDERVIFFLKKTMCWNRWPDHLSFVTTKSAERFLDASVHLLSTEADIIGISQELTKLRLDSEDYRGVEMLYKASSNKFNNFSLSGSDYFELYTDLHNLEKTANITYLEHQRVRKELTFLVRTIVKYDNEYVQESSPSIIYFSRATKLIRQGLDKPFLLWKITRFIISQRPEIIPWFLTEMDLCALSFGLIDELTFHSNETEIKRELWRRSIRLVFKSLPETEDHGLEIARLIAQIFFQLNNDKYSIPYNNRNREKEFTDKVARDKFEKEFLEILENAPSTQWPVKGTPSSYLLPAVFDNLSQLFILYKHKPFYDNGTIQFPMLQWDGMFWLLKIATYWKYNTVMKNYGGHVNKIATEFLRLYLSILEIQEVKSYDPFEDKEKITVPLWSEKIERLERLDWIYPVYALNKLGKFGNFLTPRFEFTVTTDRYHRLNSFTADVLRTHIGVLLQVIRKSVLPGISYGFGIEKLQSIKVRLEGQIIEYIRRHMVDAPEESRIDLFSYNKEWQHQQSEKEALLPQLAQAINWFSDKTSIINAILESADIIKWLIFLDYVSSQGIKITIIDRIKSRDLTAFLKQLHWVPEVQTILIKLARYPQLVEKYEEALSYWEKMVITKDSKENKEQLYLSTLMLAFFRHDENLLNSVEAPGYFQGSSSQMNYYAEKEFYRGLIYIEADPAKAYDILNNLVYRYKEYVVIGLNRMVAKMNMAAREKNTDLYREAYEEWQTLKEDVYRDTDLKFLEPDLSSNLMEILHHLREFEKQDQVFTAMPLAAKMVPLTLESRIRSLAVQKRVADGLALIESAKTYHEFAHYTDIEFINDLEIEIRGIDNVEELKMQHARIFNSTPEKLIKILPEKFNGKIEVHGFLVKEIINAVDKLLDKIKSIEEIKLEDKYNDLVELVLDARLNSLNWHVGGQSRGGYSLSKSGNPGPQPGERDIPVFDANKKLLLNCEALIYRGISNTPLHLQKIFNYHHRRDAFVVLLYDTGFMKKGFDGNWNEYNIELFPETVFPAGMEIKEPLTDFTKEFGCNSSAIKVAMSIHGTETIVYHIFVNMNYRLEVGALTS